MTLLSSTITNCAAARIRIAVQFFMRSSPSVGGTLPRPSGAMLRGGGAGASARSGECADQRRVLRPGSAAARRGRRRRSRPATKPGRHRRREQATTRRPARSGRPSTSRPGRRPGARGRRARPARASRRGPRVPGSSSSSSIGSPAWKNQTSSIGSRCIALKWPPSAASSTTIAVPDRPAVALLPDPRLAEQAALERQRLEAERGHELVDAYRARRRATRHVTRVERSKVMARRAQPVADDSSGVTRTNASSNPRPSAEPPVENPCRPTANLDEAGRPGRLDVIDDERDPRIPADVAPLLRAAHAMAADDDRVGVRVRSGTRPA